MAKSSLDKEMTPYNPKIVFHIHGIIRVEMNQRDDSRWMIKMINESNNQESSIYRSLSHNEAIALVTFITNKLNEKETSKKTFKEENFKKEIKILIRSKRQR